MASQKPFHRALLALGLLTWAAPISSAQTSALQDDVSTVVARLDFGRYKAAIEGLTQFGDRQAGSQSNLDALDWIEAELRRYGYTNVERLTYRIGNGEVQNLYATKVGVSRPDEMYMVSAHMDGMGGGEAADDDASGCAVVLELARVLGSSDVQTGRSVRLMFWNGEERGSVGSGIYATDRARLQGIEDPPGSGQYPEPKWLGIIQHDMVLFDHGLPPADSQSAVADLDIEYQEKSARGGDSANLAAVLLDANRSFAGDYPASIGSNMRATDSVPFQDHAPAVSIRENERIAEIGERSNPHWHRRTDTFGTFSDLDFRLGFNAAQTTLGAIGRLSVLQLEEVATPGR